MIEIEYSQIEGFKDWLKENFGMSLDGVFKYSIQRLNRQSILQKFFREEHKTHIDVYRNGMGWQCNLEKAVCGTHIKNVSEYNDDLDGLFFEDATQQGINAAIELLKL